jgi:Domain of unknown function (DUF4160)
MPRISAFLGIVIAMYFDDHPPPHFHALYSGESVSIGIDPLTVLAGRLPPRVLGYVIRVGRAAPRGAAGRLGARGSQSAPEPDSAAEVKYRHAHGTP